uniref:Uncharacterized protein n=1 Tax=Anguilla anguilla TaxID=7936 RepID=A0A0E9SWK7_ANGAN
MKTDPFSLFLSENSRRRCLTTPRRAGVKLQPRRYSKGTRGGNNNGAGLHQILQRLFTRLP